MKVIDGVEYYTKGELFKKLQVERPDVDARGTSYINRAIRCGYLRGVFTPVTIEGWRGVLIPKNIGDEFIRTRRATKDAKDCKCNITEKINRKRHRAFEKKIHKGILEGKGIANNLTKHIQTNPTGMVEVTLERGIRYEFTRE